MFKFFRKKEEPQKVYPYSRFRGGSYDSQSAFSSVSIIEKFIIIVLPILQTYIVYIMLDMTGLILCIRLLIAIGIEIILMILIYFFSNWMSSLDLD